jgi:hypothetical protein
LISAARSTGRILCCGAVRSTSAIAPGGVVTRIVQRILALTAATWHNDHTDQLVMRSLIAYDHYWPLGIGRLSGITALNVGELPCSTGELRILAAAASITVGGAVDLRDTATGRSSRNNTR